jgi:hypothetical protein
MDPKTGKWVVSGGASADMPADRARAIVEMVMSPELQVRRFAASEFAGLPADQQAVVYKVIAEEFPNARGVSGWSEMGKEVRDLLHGADPSPERMQAIQSAAADAGLGPGWQAERKGVGTEETESLSYDDSVRPVEPDSLGDVAPGDPAAVDAGTRGPTRPKSVDAKAIRSRLSKDPAYLRGPESSAVLTQDGDEVVPFRVVGEGGSIGPQDYPGIQQANRREASLEANNALLMGAISQRYGSPQELARRIADAHAAGDTKTVSRLLAEVEEIKDSLPLENTPPAPYAPSDIQAANSLRRPVDIFTDAAESFAAGRVGQTGVSPGLRMWEMIRSKGNTALTPGAKGSGISSPEEFADLVLSEMDPDRLPAGEAMGDFRQRIIDNAREQFWSGGAPVIKTREQAAADDAAFDAMGNPADLAMPEGPVVAAEGVGNVGSSGAPKSLRESQAADKRPPSAVRGRDASMGLPDVGKVPRNLEAGIENFGTPASKFGRKKVALEGVPGVPADQLDDARKAALYNSIRYALNQGKLPYRHPETGAVMAATVTQKTTPEKLQAMLDSFPHDLVPEDEVEQVSQLLDPFARIQSANAPKPQRDFAPPPPGFTRDSTGKLVRDGYGMIEDTVDPEEVLYSPTGEYEIEVQDDIPWLREKTPEELEASSKPVDMDDDSSVVSGGKGETPDLERSVRIILDPNSSAEDLESAREAMREALAARDSIDDPEMRAEYERQFIQPLRDAAAERARKMDKGEVTPPAAADNVSEDLDASATPVDEEPNVNGAGLDESSPVGWNDPAPRSAPRAERTPVPEDEEPNVNGAGLDESSPVGWNDPPPRNARRTPEAEAAARTDVESAPRDQEGEAADAAARTDAEQSDAANPSAPQKKPGLLGRAAGALWNNKGRIAAAAAGAGGLYWLAESMTGGAPYAAGDEPLKVGGGGPIPAGQAMPGQAGAMQVPMTPEDRIRRVREIMSRAPERPLIQGTIQRPF